MFMFIIIVVVIIISCLLQVQGLGYDEQMSISASDDNL